MSERNLRKTQVGIVTSDKMQKTVVFQSRTELSIRFTIRSLTVQLKSRLMTRTMSAE